MEKCKRMKRQRCMSKNWISSWLWKSSKTRQQYCRLESFAMKTDISTNGSMVKNHISLKLDSDTLQYGKLRSYCGSRLVKFVLWIFIDFKDTFETGESFFIIFFSFTFFTYSKWNSDSRTGRWGKAVTSLQCQCLNWLMTDACAKVILMENCSCLQKLLSRLSRRSLGLRTKTFGRHWSSPVWTKRLVVVVVVVLLCVDDRACLCHARRKMHLIKKGMPAGPH